MTKHQFPLWHEVMMKVWHEWHEGVILTEVPPHSSARCPLAWPPGSCKGSKGDHGEGIFQGLCKCDCRGSWASAGRAESLLPPWGMAAQPRLPPELACAGMAPLAGTGRELPPALVVLLPSPPQRLREMAKLTRTAADAHLRRGIRRSSSSGNFARSLFAGSWLQASEKLQCSLFQSIPPVTFASRVSSGRLITQEGSCPAEASTGLFLLELPLQQSKIRAPKDHWFPDTRGRSCAHWLKMLNWASELHHHEPLWSI